MAAAEPSLQLHLEPKEPIEISELTGALTAIARQYQAYAIENELASKNSEARLLVSAVKPGSIDINLVPDLTSMVVMAGPLLAPLIDKLELIEKFGKHLKSLIDLFAKKRETTAGDNITIKDCDDATNIVKPIASHGGSQTFNVINGPVTVQLLTISAQEAASILETAAQEKALLQNPNAEIVQRVPMIWKRLDRDSVKSAAKTTPDRALIEEIDEKPHAVFFTDEMSHLKNQMIDDEDNPYQAIYFVDVVVSRSSGKVVSYRVIGYHGKEELEALPPA
ncbi:hypothetical protein A5906_24520 [Bradyrhizobium sacchari]|uniref:Uncharacterized protein n=1 Tax=Bradyrhizobium sacchari TaxID=1399419 RepID=A0A560K593_9BRAD|nr:hypothetical protein [Bradyrhizobium sacchari]OPY99993.1 hypothetical protein A5906_24520 [Bradyrhizobium sacchari]TWB54063.1 hypothetical protein FBZ94_108351 [Bradyrhizobium sacchari]TWB78511.1 hypothetical protein FBZ95_103351 [Bradyrhizobium sacchari]